MKAFASLLLILTSTLVAGAARAAGEPPPPARSQAPSSTNEALETDPDTEPLLVWLGAHPAVRMSVAITGGMLAYHQGYPPFGDYGGPSFGAELRVHPYGPHGFLLGFTEAIAGPTPATSSFLPTFANLSLVDADYSLRLFTDRAKPRGHEALGVYLEGGPFLGVHGNSASDHTTLGGRIAATMDGNIARLCLGLTASARFGAPLGIGGGATEEIFTIGLRFGGTFDVSTRTPPAPAVLQPTPR